MLDLWRTIALTGGARIYSLAAQMGMLVLTARALGPAGRGEFAAALTWASLFYTVGYLSLGQVALHRASNTRDRSWLGPTLGSLFAITVAVTVAAWVIAAATYGFSNGRLYGELPPYVMALALAAVPLLIWEQYGSSLLMAIDRLPVYNRAQVVGRTTGLLLVVVLVVGLGWGVGAALAANLVGQAVVAGGGLAVLVRLVRGQVSPHRATIATLLRGGLKLHLNAIGTFLFSGASILIVQYYRGAEETGFFQLAVQLMTAILLVPQAASMVLYSEVAREGPNGAWFTTRRVLLVLTALLAAAAAVGALLAPWVIPLVLGEDFRPAVPVFQMLTLALIGQTMSIVMAPQWIGRGLFWQVSAASVATGALNVFLCFTWVPRHGMFGAAWATLVVYGISVLFNGGFAWWVARRSRRPPAASDVSPAANSAEVAFGRRTPGS